MVATTRKYASQLRFHRHKWSFALVVWGKKSGLVGEQKQNIIAKINIDNQWEWESQEKVERILSE